MKFLKKERFQKLSMLALISMLVVFNIQPAVTQLENNVTMNSESVKLDSEKIGEFYAWFLEYGEFVAQWFVVIILVISAGLIYNQMKAQNTVRTGENFLRLADYLNKEEHKKNVDIIISEKNKDPESIKKSDSELTPELQTAISRVRDNYHVIGMMLNSKMVHPLDFVKLHYREGRDIWNLLEENVKKTNEERKISKKMGEEYFRGFSYVGEICNFWHQLSNAERYLVITGWFSINPESIYFHIRTFFTNLRKKN